MNLYGVTTSPPPSTAGKRLDLVGTLVTRIFLHCDLSFASTRAADGGNGKKTALQGRSSISSNLESKQDRRGGAPENLNLAWGSCTVSFSTWRECPSGECSSHCSKELEVRTGFRLDHHGSPVSVHSLSDCGKPGRTVAQSTRRLILYNFSRPFQKPPLKTVFLSCEKSRHAHQWAQGGQILSLL